MKPYLNAKRAVENEAKKRLASRAYFVYPGIIFDKARYSSYLPGLFLTYLSWIKYFNNLRPISRRDFATNIENILLGKRVHYSKEANLSKAIVCLRQNHYTVVDN